MGADHWNLSIHCIPKRGMTLQAGLAASAQGAIEAIVPRAIVST
uniref:Uncharacterized protein n=1 Tax=Rhizobium leguminosarum bv. viciae TaxID=387 RepID=A0A0U3ATU1_RHILV|nr:hypothetical protein [Rhizobium leguminosarum bv. viciae]